MDPIKHPTQPVTREEVENSLKLLEQAGSHTYEELQALREELLRE